jgi:hypothetical protein
VKLHQRKLDHSENFDSKNEQEITNSEYVEEGKSVRETQEDHIMTRNDKEPKHNSLSSETKLSDGVTQRQRWKQRELEENQNKLDCFNNKPKIDVLDELLDLLAKNLQDRSPEMDEEMIKMWMRPALKALLGREDVLINNYGKKIGRALERRSDTNKFSTTSEFQAGKESR